MHFSSCVKWVKTPLESAFEQLESGDSSSALASFEESYLLVDWLEPWAMRTDWHRATGISPSIHMCMFAYPACFPHCFYISLSKISCRNNLPIHAFLVYNAFSLLHHNPFPLSSPQSPLVDCPTNLDTTTNTPTNTPPTKSPWTVFLTIALAMVSSCFHSVGNLPPECEEDDVRVLCERFGAVEGCR
jgi:hypothetical protein